MFWLECAAALAMLVVAFVGIAAYSRYEKRARWKRLLDAGLIAEVASVSSLPIQRVIEIDFGYGKEVWLIFREDLRLDRDSLIFRDARAFPRDESLPEDLARRKEWMGVRF